MTDSTLQRKIGVIGLGYVGLPLAVEFSRHFDVVGFDINLQRIRALSSGADDTKEVSAADLANANRLLLSADTQDLDDCDFYVITVPTPIDEHKSPDLGPLKTASRTVGTMLSRGDFVVYESTVFPGATEEVCVPILESASNLTLNRDFWVGYSPERINPGDKVHQLSSILKVTSGSTPEAADIIDRVYQTIITAGTHQASSIKVAEAAKVIENTQRDINIALVNELSLIFDRLNIDTQEVLEAAGTKWNFLPFRPGLVGGHCIGVDPYYLTHKAQAIGYHPEMILAGRRINDKMGTRVADRVMKLMTKKRIHIVDSEILIMGLTFKENCPDIRNTRVIDLIQEFRQFNCNISVYDPWADKTQVLEEYQIQLCEDPQPSSFDAIILAVGHDDFIEMGVENIRKLGKPDTILFDTKYLFTREEVDGRL